MPAHWALPYLGISYDVCDCVQLVERVQREVFGRVLVLPSDRPDSPWASSIKVLEGCRDLASPILHPVDGAVALMRCRGRLNHVGVVAMMHEEPYVLHSLRSAAQVCLHRARDLGKHGTDLEGYYMPNVVAHV